MSTVDTPGGRKGMVVVVEQDPRILYAIARALPKPFGAHSLASFDEFDLGRYQDGRIVVLVLGPSQVKEDVLDKVGSLLRDRSGTGAVMVVAEPSTEVLRLSLRAGIDDAIAFGDIERQLPQAVADLLLQLDNEMSAAAAAAAAAEAIRSAAPPREKQGWVTMVFSPKGGVGKSVVSVNLATALARETKKPVVIFDLDLQFGDVAVMLRLNPVHTVVDAVSAGDLLDESLLQTFLVQHERSNVWVLAAPTAPSEADQVTPPDMIRILGLLRQMFDFVVIDSPPHLSEVVLQAVAESDTIGFIVALDVPSVKNARLGLQAFGLLQLPMERVLLILNRADSKVHLAVNDLERALEMKVDLALPSEAAVPQSVNQGVPVMLEYPKSRFATNITQLSSMVLARAQGAVPAKVPSR
jgi:pilus assembly protein CpaE